MPNTTGSLILKIVGKTLALPRALSRFDFAQNSIIKTSGIVHPMPPIQGKLKISSLVNICLATCPKEYALVLAAIPASITGLSIPDNTQLEIPIE